MIEENYKAEKREEADTLEKVASKGLTVKRTFKYRPEGNKRGTRKIAREHKV